MWRGGYLPSFRASRYRYGTLLYPLISLCPRCDSIANMGSAAVTTTFHLLIDSSFGCLATHMNTSHVRLRGDREATEHAPRQIRRVCKGGRRLWVMKDRLSNPRFRCPRSGCDVQVPRGTIPSRCGRGVAFAEEERSTVSGR